ncbi:diphosphate--fructose-6-phosphate 1-phosphotransferase, partial [bacterium]|nr:diphosphate--fructose-6-phosphate 1-phosphotransferase [bacterium]
MPTAVHQLLADHLISFESHHSPFERAIREIPLPVIDEFQHNGTLVCPEFVASNREIVGDTADLTRDAFPALSAQLGNFVLTAVRGQSTPSGKRIAVLFSGGPAAGGHNVVAGIRRILGPDNTLFGVKAGPKGLMNGDCFEIGMSDVDAILNTGGFDFLGSDRTKIKTDDDFERVLKTVKDFHLDGIIVVGGDDSNTNAAFIGEYLAPHGCSVVGVPKTIDGDLQVSDLVPISFGFDTATKIYSEIVGNILQDTPSSRKYWHFVKLMGRSASHVALEVALQTHPAVTLISEEIADRSLSLGQVVDQIATVVVDRASRGINHGVVLIPEGVIEFIPEIKALIRSLNEFVASRQSELDGLSLAQRVALLQTGLSGELAAVLAMLPESVQTKLLMDRDSH